VVSDYWVYHCKYCRLIVLWIVLFSEQFSDQFWLLKFCPRLSRSVRCPDPFFLQRSISWPLRSPCNSDRRLRLKVFIGSLPACVSRSPRCWDRALWCLIMGSWIARPTTDPIGADSVKKMATAIGPLAKGQRRSVLQRDHVRPRPDGNFARTLVRLPPAGWPS
jgi:hypothetical protein